MSRTGLDLRERYCQPEWLDQPGIEPAERLAALRGLARVNAFSRTASQLWRVIRNRLDPRERGEYKILDLACGGGNVAIALEKLARRNGHPVRVFGCDISEETLELARRNADQQRSDVEFFQRDLIRDQIPEGYDVVCSSLFLHHLPGDAVAALLNSADGNARRLVVMSDLCRSRWGYRLAWWGVRLLSRSPIVHFDGPASVQAAFSLPEMHDLLTAAGVSDFELTRVWPERLLLSWRPQGAEAPSEIPE